MVCLYLWASVAALSPVIVLLRSHKAALQLQPSLCDSCADSPRLCYTMSSCGAERSGVVGDICSSPPAKSPHHMALFMRSLFHIPAMWKKKAQKHTNSVQMTTEEIQLQETHSPPTLPWAHSDLCCMQTRMGGWACCMLCPISNYGRIFIVSSAALLALHCPSRTCHVGVCEQYLESPWSQNWEAPAPFDLLCGSHVWGSGTGKSLAVSWLAKFLLCGLVIWGWPQTCTGRPGAVMKPPSVFWLSQSDSSAVCACSASASSRAMQHPCKVPQSCEDSQLRVCL